MSAKKYLFLILALFVTLLLAGCNCTNEQVESLLITAESPISGELINSLTPVFNWNGSMSCEPEDYWLRIEENIGFGGHTLNSKTPGNGVPYTLSGNSLLPGREYYWNVKAVNSHIEESQAFSPPSENAYFYTGPVCSGETLIAPEIDFPNHRYWYPETDNWIDHNHLQEFKWTYKGGCLPSYYDYQFAADAAFTNIVLEGTTTEIYTQHIFETFPNCSTLFWRVRANDGNTTGPWSDVQDFHWVKDDTCYQTHYLSDESGRIGVRLYEDVCSLTGMQAPEGVGLKPGCVQYTPELKVHADGEMTSLDHEMWSFQAYLGSGKCPSTGLDQKNFYIGGNNYFYVLTPGMYCVSISRSQVVDNQGTDISLMKGIWTDPRMNDFVAMRTVEMASGFQDAEVRFGWDRIDEIFLTFPLERVKNCYFGPEKLCPIVEFTEAGSAIPIYARDQKSEWMLTEVHGTPCYVQLESSLLEKYEIEVAEDGFSIADLEFFPQPSPCTPILERTCSSYKGQSSCESAGCKWNVVVGAAVVEFCSDK